MISFIFHFPFLIVHFLIWDFLSSEFSDKEKSAACDIHSALSSFCIEHVDSPLLPMENDK
jgi:hypothetical protein